MYNEVNNLVSGTTYRKERKNPMKKMLAILLCVLMMLTSASVLAEQTVAELAAAAESLTHDELVAKAMEEDGTFIVYGNKSRGLTRFHSLLTTFGLQSRLVTDSTQAAQAINEPIDWERVDTIKHEWQERSMQFLKNNL